MLLQVTDPSSIPDSMFSDLFQRYGITGLLCGALLFLVLRQNKNAQKRITDLEDAQEGIYKANIEAHKSMISDYVELVRQKIQILSDLTGCLNAIKSTLERMERKG